MLARRFTTWATAAHPLWMCGMRPFFLATATSAVLLILPWWAYLTVGSSVPGAAGGALAWHAHELLFGFVMASVIGFLLTALPEFTGTPEFSERLVRQLALAWLVARGAFCWGASVGGWAMLPSALAHAALLGLLLWHAAPRIWREPDQPQRAFVWILLALAACSLGFHADVLQGHASPMRWLYATVGVYMVLVIVALSRISMRIVNHALEEAGSTERYLARPPRRNLAIVCISLFTALEWWGVAPRLSGWLALACAAAVLHLLNDWHVGRALLRRWPLMLYAAYACMALGYGLMGVALVSPWGNVAGARHLLTVGTLGLAILAAMAIAGRAHSGWLRDERRWLPLGAAALALAAAVRAATVWLPVAPPLLWTCAAALWCLAFAAYTLAMLPVLARARPDGQRGCQAG